MIDKLEDPENLVKQRRAIQKITLLPSIPPMLQKIIQISADPSSSAEDLQKTIEKDQSIAAAILRLANSAYYGYSREVSDIKNAIVIIGFKTSVSIAISVSVLKTMSAQFTGKEFDKNEFWKHTIATGEAARLIAIKTGYSNSSQAYIIGLLHDIGKVVLHFLNGRDFEDAVFDARAMDEPLHKFETQIFGFDHQTAGSWLGDRWKLPLSIISGIQYHHNIKSCPKDHLMDALIAHVANYSAKTAKLGDSGDRQIPRLSTYVKSKLHLDNQKLKEISTELEKKREEIDLYLETIL
ncbi:HDOD domain-containing protein [candidate division KSB1 bacterium]